MTSLGYVLLCVAAVLVVISELGRDEGPHSKAYRDRERATDKAKDEFLAAVRNGDRATALQRYTALCRTFAVKDFERMFKPDCARAAMSFSCVGYRYFDVPDARKPECLELQ